MQLPITENPVVCRRLRAKGTPGMHYTELVDFEDGFYDSATFWCLATGECVGPDDNFVHPHECIPGRQCFKHPEDDSHAT